MTPSRTACDAARAALVRGADGGGHLAECARCRSFAARLGRVDAALADDGRAAGDVALPAALRGRILLAARSVGRSEPAGGGAASPRGRVLDLALRAAAVAAVLVAGAWLLPEPVFAADGALSVPAIPSLGIGDAIDARLASLPTLADAVPTEVPIDPVPFAAGAALLVAGAWALTVSRRTA